MNKIKTEPYRDTFTRTTVYIPITSERIAEHAATFAYADCVGGWEVYEAIEPAGESPQWYDFEWEGVIPPDNEWTPDHLETTTFDIPVTHPAAKL